MNIRQLLSDNKIAIISLLLFISSLILFLLNNTHEQLWYDETLVLHFSNMDWGSMIHETAFNGAEDHPPLFHIIIKTLRVIFDNSLFVLRGFSALCGGILIVLTFLFTKKIFNTKIAFFSAALLMTNPIIISYAQELRMYMLVSLLVFINLSCFYLALNKKKRKYWIIYTITAALGLYTHYYFAFTFIITFIYLCVFFIINRYSIKDNKRIILFYISSTIIPLCLFIPWLPAFLKQRAEMTAANWMEKISVNSIYKLIGYFYSSKFSTDINPFIPSLYFSIFSLIFFLYGFFFSIRNKQSLIKTVFFVIAFVAPIIISFVYSIFISSIIKYRYFIMYFPFFIIISAYGLCNVPFKYVPVFLLIILLVFTAPNAYFIYTENFNGNMRDVSSSLKQRLKKDEAIITYHFTVFFPLCYYLDYYDKLYLYYYRDEDFPGCYGTNLRKETNIVGDKIWEILDKQSSVWIVENEHDHKITKLILKKDKDYIIDPAKRIEIFAPKYSWQKVQLIHLIKTKQ